MDSRSWNNLIADFAPPFGAFLQSWEWGEVQVSLGFPIERIHRVVEGKTVLAQAIWQPLPLGASYWFVPKGPLGDAAPSVMIDVLRKELGTGAFLKVEPVNVPEKSRFASRAHVYHAATGV